MNHRSDPWAFHRLYAPFRSQLLASLGDTRFAASTITQVTAAYYGRRPFTALAEPPPSGMRVVDASAPAAERSFWEYCVGTITPAGTDVRLAAPTAGEAQRLAAGLSLVRRHWPEVWEIFPRYCPHLCLIEGGSFLSVSDPKAFGTLFLTPGIEHVEEIALTIVHELAHQELFLVNVVDPLVRRDARERLRFAPFQGKLRPPIGRLHAAHALFRMGQLTRRMGGAFTSAVARDLRAALSVLDAAELTDFANHALLPRYRRQLELTENP